MRQSLLGRMSASNNSQSPQWCRFGSLPLPLPHTRTPHASPATIDNRKLDIWIRMAPSPVRPFLLLTATLQRAIHTD